MVSIKSPDPYIVASFVQEYILQTNKRETNTMPATNPLIYSAVLPVNYALAMATQMWEKPFKSDLTYGPIHNIEPTHDTAWVTKNQRLDSPGLKDKKKKLLVFYFCFLCLFFLK